MRIRCFS